jgi:hypothetical protein
MPRGDEQPHHRIPEYLLAVDVWRPTPFATVGDLVAGQVVGNIFAGIDVDVAVRDSDAWLYRLGYNITLLGKIVFVNNSPI